MNREGQDSDLVSAQNARITAVNSVFTSRKANRHRWNSGSGYQDNAIESTTSFRIALKLLIDSKYIICPAAGDSHATFRLTRTNFEITGVCGPLC